MSDRPPWMLGPTEQEQHVYHARINDDPESRWIQVRPLLDAQHRKSMRYVEQHSKPGPDGSRIISGFDWQAWIVPGALDTDEEEQ